MSERGNGWIGMAGVRIIRTANTVNTGTEHQPKTARVQIAAMESQAAVFWAAGDDYLKACRTICSTSRSSRKCLRSLATASLFFSLSQASSCGTKQAENQTESMHRGYDSSGCAGTLWQYHGEACKSVL